MVSMSEATAKHDAEKLNVLRITRTRLLFELLLRIIHYQWSTFASQNAKALTKHAESDVASKRAEESPP